MRRRLLFDLDGTLTDPRAGIVRSFQYAFERIGITAPAEAELLTFIGPPLQDSFRKVLGAENAALLPDAIAAYRERFRTQGMFENVVYPGIADALRALAAQGNVLFVVTSKPTVFAQPILEHFQLAQFFSAVHGSELSGERSDKAELLAHTLQTHAIRPQEAVMIGDRLHDVLAAKRNNVTAAGVLWGYGDREELVTAGAEHLFSSVAQMVSGLLTLEVPQAQ